MAMKLISGVFREVWQSSAPLDGGASEPITTGIACSAATFARVEPELRIVQTIGSPHITAVASIVNRKVVVVISNIAAPGNTATWVLTVLLHHSIQQGRGTATPSVSLLPDVSGFGVTGSGALVKSVGPSLSGAIMDGVPSTPAQAQALAEMAAAYGWYDVQRARAVALLGAEVLTKSPVLGQLSTYAPRTGLGSTPRLGGGARVTAGDAGEGNYVPLSFSVIDNPKVSPWYLAWEGAYLTPAGTSYELGCFGLMEATAGRGIFVFECASSLFSGYPTAAAATKHILVLNTGGSSTGTDSGVVVDNDVLHDWALAGNGETLWLQKNGATVYSTPDLSMVSAVPCRIVARGNTHYTDVTKFVFFS